MQRPATYLSLASTLAFAVWVILMWWPNSDAEKQVQKPEIEKAKPVKMAKAEMPKTAPSILTLPAPPPSAPKPVPVVEKTPAPNPTPEIKEIVQAETPPTSIQKPKIKKEVVDVKPSSKPKPIKKIEPKPTPQKPLPKKIVKPKPAPQPKPMEKTIEATQVTAAQGRALLRVLEHGKGPLIEIAWPNNSAKRSQLFNAFKSCYGMENALMDVRGDLYRRVDPVNSRWEINLDRFSGFLREASGQLTPSENRQIRAIKNHHDRLYGANPVRIFPRSVDASLLGGFNRLLGGDYKSAGSIQATYEIENNQVYVSKIRRDGKTLSGRIKLLGYGRC